MKRISYLETCHPRNLLSGIYVFVLRLGSQLRENNSAAVSLHVSRFTKYVCLLLILFSLLASLFTIHAHAKLENGMKADLVLGQPDFFARTANNSGRGARTLNSPHMVRFMEGRLYVVDLNNHRILVWREFPGKNFEEADFVLGQQTFTTATRDLGGIGPSTLDFPRDALVHGGKFYIADENNNRILVHNSVPESSFASADFVLGQPNFTNGLSNSVAGGDGNGFSTQSSLDDGKKVFIYEDKLLVADRLNNRVMIWTRIPNATNQPADIVLGQPHFTIAVANQGGISSRSLRSPNDIHVTGGRLFVVDQNNHRILIWNKFPTEIHAPADLVLGQPDFKSGAANQNRSASAFTLNTPSSVTSDGVRLFVSDVLNHRVLVWNKLPLRNNQPADVVIGQSNATLTASGFGPGRFNRPRGISTDGRRLFVADQSNHRVLIFNVTESSFGDLGPQFSQGKAVVGKVFWDFDGDGRQDSPPTLKLRRTRPASQARRQDA